MSALPESEGNPTVLQKLWDYFEGPFFWGGVGVLVGVIISPVTFKSLFMIAWLMLAIGIMRERFFQRNSWGVTVAGNFGLCVVLALGVGGLYKVVPKPKEPPSIDETLNAFGKKFPGLLSPRDASVAKTAKSAPRTQPIPRPPQFAGLVFSFYLPEEGQFPQLSQSLRMRSDRSIDVEVFAKNISNEVAAERGDIFMEMCLECMYKVEPKGFQKLAESPESTRHKTFEFINPGLPLEPWTMSIMFPWDPPFSVELHFRYECQTCGPAKHPSQVLRVNVLSYLD
jgi:hypothetical protein